MKTPKGVRIKGGKLEIIYQCHGTRRTEVLELAPTASGFREAATIRKQRIEALRFGLRDDATSDDARHGTFADVAQQFLASAEIEVSTRGGYASALNKYWMPELQHRSVSAIDLPMLRRLDRSITWTSKKTRKNALSALRQVFAFAVDDGYRLDNPAEQLKAKRRKGEAPRPDPYTWQERETLLAWLKDNAPQTAYAFYLVAFYTGARTGELLALDWSRFDGEALTIDRARVRGLIKATKTDEARRVLVPDFVAAEIKRLPSRFAKSWIFVNQYGKPYESAYHLNRRLDDAHTATGLRRREGPYPWRHTYASIGLTNGAPPAFLAKQLGHSLAMFFSVYADWISSDSDKAQLRHIVANPAQKCAQSVPDAL